MIEKYFAIFEERHPEGWERREDTFAYRMYLKDEVLFYERRAAHRFAWETLARLKEFEGEAGYFLGSQVDTATPMFRGNKALQEMDRWAEILPTLSDL